MAGDTGKRSNSLPDRRAASRHSFRTPVAIHVGNRRAQGSVHDMSASGVRVEDTNIELPDGAKIQVEFSFFPGSPSFRLQAEVVRTTVTGGFGARFVNMSRRNQSVIGEILRRVSEGRVWEDQDTTTTFSGKFVADLDPKVHRLCAEAADLAQEPLQEWFQAQVQKAAETQIAEAKKLGYHPKGGCDCPQCRARRS